MTDRPASSERQPDTTIDIQHYLGDADLAVGEAKEFISKYGEFPDTVPTESVSFLTVEMGYDVRPESILRCGSLNELAESLDADDFKPTTSEDANGNDIKLLGGDIQVSWHDWVQLEESYLELRAALESHISRKGPVSEYLASQQRDAAPSAHEEES